MVNDFVVRIISAGRFASRCVFVRDIFVQTDKVLLKLNPKWLQKTTANFDTHLENANPIAFGFIESHWQCVFDHILFANMPRMHRSEFDHFFQWIFVNLELNVVISNRISFYSETRWAIYLNRKFTGYGLVVAHRELWVTAIRCLFRNELHIFECKLWRFIQNSIAPGRSSFHIVVGCSRFEFECWRKCGQSFFQLSEGTSLASYQRQLVLFN